jgi:ppGpp synthetase/RelA/SpoT-type nucleotidyltranferase
MKPINPKKYSKSMTDKAGIILCKNGVSSTDRNQALEILSNWRAAHSYPMGVFKQRLKRLSHKIDRNSLSAQRLKRVPSIIKKLERRYGGKKATMKLTQMQDIAGCRVIMSDIKLVNKLYHDYYEDSEIKHQKINEKDYITYPKSDGYRGIHLVYRYHSDKEKRRIYNGLLVEVQIRSRLQHIWATAVETVGFFTGQAIKSNEGEEKWEEFFRLVSSALALMENCPQVQNTPMDEKKLFLLIKKQEKSLNVRSKMKSWTKSLRYFDDLKKKNAYYFLLELDTIQEKLIISAFTKRQEQQAIAMYAKAERKIYEKKEYDAVLVGADTADLKKAYPNYFLDTREFIKYLEKIIDKY